MTTDAMPDLSREELKQLIRESGVLDEMLREAEAITPVSFHSSDEGMSDLERGLGSGGFPWGYWRKKDGRVITGPHVDYNETLLRTYVRKGYTPLSRYGKLPTPGSRVPCCPQFNQKDNQYHVLLANGGAGELSVGQVLDAGWHINPPVIHNKTISFPQLAGVEVESVECAECDKPIYGIAGTRDIIQKLRQHCRGAHEMPRRDVDEMLWAIGYYSEEPKRAPRRRPGKSKEDEAEE